MLHYLKLLVQILMSPKCGWEDVVADGISPRHVLLHGLTPLAGLAALTVGFGFIYLHHPRVDTLLIEAVVAFARYMLTYFIAVGLLTYALPKLTADGIIARERVELLTAYCVGMMALIGILENILPMELPLLQFLPIYVVVVIIQSRWFIGIEDSRLFAYAACAITAIILPVFIIDRILLPN